MPASRSPDPDRPPNPARPGRRPTAEELTASRGRTVPDLIAPGLRVLFCGINPSLYSAAVGHHFARPGNRFWPALFGGGFTDRLLQPHEGDELLRLGLGITNVVDRATASADELAPVEYVEGGRRLAEKVRAHRPSAVALLGITAYRLAFGRKHARVGPQPESLAGASLWVLPNPSGLNAHYTPAALAEQFRRLREAIAGGPIGAPGRPDATPGRD
ncbi:G/U mismatch-specific DNA glycosylase [Tautonia plasticadhaerens]|uniref:G/U mismatch-specific DNA glycosylase n=1 Tax=Tautonia plasticadhaerens TaxID=2527974 RepID=A0A518HD08_9BACT|nr:G/U mismatch-specific DNA glycosylase [Tautonia plasticadhaerens]QDV38720.1 G/U mismatch-specific DNA glycosylase [Tautonia plasticadhaerens]